MSIPSGSSLPSRGRTASVMVTVAVLLASGVMPRALADPDDVAPPEPVPGMETPGPEVLEHMVLSDDPAVAPPPIPLAIPFGTPEGQDPTPFVGAAPFESPTISPSEGATVGIAK